MKFPLLSFSRRVLGSFRRNQGLLLAGAVAYYALLSLVPPWGGVGPAKF